MANIPDDAKICSYCNGVGEIRRQELNGEMRGGYCHICNGNGIVKKRPREQFDLSTELDPTKPVPDIPPEEDEPKAGWRPASK